MTENKFLSRLLAQILERLNVIVRHPLKKAYWENPIQFIGLIFVYIPMIVIIILSITFVSSIIFFQKSLENVINYIFVAFAVSAFFIAIGMMIVGNRRYNRMPERNIDSHLQIGNNTKNIFVVHGHDTKIKDEVVDYLTKLSLNPIVLQDAPSRGLTIIEKVEYYVAKTSFAIVILTRDDYGFPKEDFDIDKMRTAKFKSELNMLSVNQLANLQDPEKNKLIIFGNLCLSLLDFIKYRARQNVIFELGITIGHLDRNNVRVLYEDAVELPTDIHGLSYISLNGAWREDILKELKAAKIECKEI